MVSRFSRGRPSWIAKWNDLSNSESLCRSDAFHRFGSIHPMVWDKMSFEEFQAIWAILNIGNGMILAILNLYKAPMPLIKFRLNLTWFW